MFTAALILGRRFNANKFIDSFITKYELTYQRQNKRRIRWLISFFVLLGALFCIKPFFEEVLLLDIEAKEGSCKNWSIPYEIRRAISNHAKNERAGNPICGAKENINTADKVIVTYILEGACGKYEYGESEGIIPGACGNDYRYYMVGLMNGNIIEPITIGGKSGFMDKEIKIVGDTIELNGLTVGEDDPSCCPSVPETKKFKIEQNGFYEITIEAGVSPVDLRGIYHIKEFQNCCWLGESHTAKYHHLQLNHAIRFTGYDYDKNGKLTIDVDAVALATEAEQIPKIKDGDLIDVHCSFLYGAETGHYAPLVHCAADSISRVEAKK